MLGNSATMFRSTSHCRENVYDLDLSGSEEVSWHWKVKGGKQN